MNTNKPNILVNNKAEFYQSLEHYFRGQTESKNAFDVGLEVIFEIRPPDSRSNFDAKCKTKFIAKIVDRNAFQKFQEDGIRWNEKFSFKYTKCETLEELSNHLKMVSNLEEISKKEYEITKSIQELIGLMDEDSLKFASTEPEFWSGAIGHIKRKISLYANTIPTFEVLQPQKTDERTDEDIVADFQKMIKKALEDNLYPEYDKILTMNRDGTIITKFEKKADRYAPLTSPEFAIPDMNYTREEWESKISENSNGTAFQNAFGTNELIVDEEIIAIAKGFFVGPLTAQRGKALAAETLRFDSFEELKESITKQAQEKDMFLYMMFKQETTVMTGLDVFALTEEQREKLPKKTSYIWRGAFLDKQ
jgi:hypothetical protein